MSWRSQGRVAAANLRDRGRMRSRSRLRLPLNPGLLGRRGGPASQRRTSSVVARWVAGKSATTLLVRRRPPSEPEEVHWNALPVECPVAQLCRMRRGAGRSYLHNCVPGTPGGECFPRVRPLPRSMPQPPIPTPGGAAASYPRRANRTIYVYVDKCEGGRPPWASF